MPTPSESSPTPVEAWGHNLPSQSPVRPWLETAQLAYNELLERDKARQREMEELRDLLAATRSLHEREQLEREEEALRLRRVLLMLTLKTAADQQAAQQAAQREQAAAEREAKLLAELAARDAAAATRSKGKSLLPPLPNLPGYHERVLWLAEHFPGKMEPSCAQQEARVRSAPKLVTVVTRAKLFRVSPRWLAFGTRGVKTADVAGFGARLRAIRLERGLGQRTVAERTKAAAGRVACSTVSMLETDPTICPTLPTVEVLAGVLNVDPAWLAFGGT